MLNTIDLDRLVQPASALALTYARQLESVEVEEKSPGQFVSEADHAVEHLIRDILRKELGDVAILGEEGGGSLDQSTSGWVIDPIDGTSNFLRGLPIWGISVGYLDKGRSVAGVISLPALGITLAAHLGKGVTLNGSRLRPISQKKTSGVKMIALGENDFEAGIVTDARAQTFREEGHAVVRYRCAVFALANVALGRLDGYNEKRMRFVGHRCSLDYLPGSWLASRSAASGAQAILGGGSW